MTESLIKRIKLIARPLLHNCNLSTSCWGHAVLHTTDVIQLRPTTYHTTFPLYLVHGNAPGIFHLRKFGCMVYAPISPPKHNLLLSTWSHLLKIYLQPGMLIVYLMRIIF
jgi:hypothetical protein